EEDIEDTDDSMDDAETSKEDGFAYSIDRITEFDLEIELLNGDEIDYELDRRNDEAKIQRENGEEIEITGEEAMDEIFNLLESTEINLERTLNEMMEEVLVYFDISADEVDEFKLDIKFEESQEIEFKYNRRERDEN